MPTYEYTCKNCGETLEVFQSFSEKPLRKHAECGGELKKVFHARGVVFKGSGFYSTDSRSSSASSSKKSEPSKKGESSKSEKTTKSETSTPAASSSTASD
ncbi:MAG TPA: FmdB family zinc ribbon protein [Acidimicrobiia bacterium]|nr:FmdB family zinc ribbon protein [Acidimicrobiia bacterium]